MPKRNLAWMLVIFLVVLLFWTLPGTLASRDSLYRAFGPLVAVRAQIQKHYVDDVDDERLLEGAIQGMVAELDRFSGYIGPEDYQDFRDRQTEGAFNGVGIEVDLVDGVPTVVSPIEGTPAFYAGITSGDRIVEIDGQTTEGMRLMDAVRRITGPPGTVVKLKLLDWPTRKLHEVVLRRTRVSIASVKGFSHTAEGGWDYLIDPDHGIGYVRVSSFVESTVPQLNDAIRKLREAGMQGLVLDLRFNPGGLLESAVDMCDSFLREGLIVSTRGRRSDEKRWYAKPESTMPDLPLAVLINGVSASASEIVAGALQDHRRATIVGERSFGKGSVQNIIELKAHGALKLTTAYYYLPSGRRIHRPDDMPPSDKWGITPDIDVPLTDDQVEAIVDGRRLADAVSYDGSSAGEAGGHGVEVEGSAETHSVPIDPQLAAALRVLRAELAGPTTHDGDTAERAPQKQN